MKKRKWPFVHVVKANGSEYAYFRPTKEKLPAPVGGPDFIRAYLQAMSDWERSKTAPEPQSKPLATISEIVSRYTSSTDYASLAPSSKAAYAVQIEWLLSIAGDLPIAGMERQHVNDMLAARAKTGAASHNLFLSVLRIIVRHAIQIGAMTDDPTRKIKRLKGGEHRRWTEQELSKYRERWPIGTRQRLAFSLALYTGQRLGDVFGMTWEDVSGDAIRVAQEKTGAKLVIPIHASLAEVLDAEPDKTGQIMRTHDGRPLSRNGFRTMTVKAIDDAGLPDGCVWHGLRKSAAACLAEMGCSALEIASITGHKTLSEIQRYTREADQAALARSAIARWKV